MLEPTSPLNRLDDRLSLSAEGGHEDSSCQAVRDLQIAVAPGISFLLIIIRIYRAKNRLSIAKR
jgi:hypothetical protein